MSGSTPARRRTLRHSNHWPDLLPGAGLVAYLRYRRRRNDYAKCIACCEVREKIFIRSGRCPMCRLDSATTFEQRAEALRDLGREMGVDEP